MSRRSRVARRRNIVLPRYRTAIFVHGCFWHRHAGCRQATTPKTRTEFWQYKFAKNVARDKRNIEDLKALGWNVIVVWECEIRSSKVLKCASSKVEEVRKCLNARVRELLVREEAAPLLAAEEQGEYSTRKQAGLKG